MKRRLSTPEPATRKSVIVHSKKRRLFLFAGRGRRGSARCMTAIHVLLFLFGWFQDLVQCKSVKIYIYVKEDFLPGKNITNFHPHSSLRLHCQTHHSSSVH